MKVISTNVAVRRADPSGRHDYTGIDKQPQPAIELKIPGPHYGDGSGIHGDSIGDHEHHGGADKAVYAFAREELDYWENELGREFRDGYFGENLTTTGLNLQSLLINQQIKIGDALLEVSIPRSPCATFAGWVNEPGFLKSFTDHGDCGAYFRIITPGTITAGDTMEFVGKPGHDVTMGMAFRAKMGDMDLAQYVVKVGCLATVHHEQLKAKLAKYDARQQRPQHQQHQQR
ncbi:MOSC domain-containing protein [Corynebacterium pseudodiphtheriticum]|uniref:MOSC domain-containing protein n=1 Tax=Corynebacterium pseudodiphtheriticum TaxID=37637 RepID=UPI0020BE0926|nr:MOSC domain-containing protein [Corynebacterium pseudodiphtheriticum]UQV54256.1 MOSC domain-containing protein [Corynebacterium pseudodiphtheriticum]